jgi:hypothetical protein
MTFQIDASPALTGPPSQPAPAQTPGPELTELLKQILEVQREQVAYLRALLGAHDAGARWRAFAVRWQEVFPDLPASCRKAMPELERAYGQMVTDLAERLNEEDGALENDFGLQEFLDRYGMRLAQLGTILNLVGPLADAGNQPDGERGASTS